MTELGWLGVLRHGESTGNVSAYQAETSGLEVIDIPERDADVPLSSTGREQAAAFGQWLAAQPARPDVAIVSPYLRAVQTAELALADTGISAERDERLRDRELGVLDLLTTRGVEVRHPTEAARRARLGKFYYRPPGGESWADVALRLRSLLGDLRRDWADRRVLLVGHEAVVFLVRYLVEGLTEERLLEVARDGTIANASLSSWRREASGLVPEGFNRVLEGVPATAEEEVHAEPV